MLWVSCEPVWGVEGRESLCVGWFTLRLGSGGDGGGDGFELCEMFNAVSVASSSEEIIVKSFPL